MKYFKIEAKLKKSALLMACVLSTASVFADYPLTPVGTKLAGAGETGSRDLGTLMDMGADGTMYFSALMHVAYLAESGVQLDFHQGSGGSMEFSFGINTNGQFLAGIGTGSPATAGIAKTGNTYFLVVKLVASAAGSDTAYLKAYAPGDTIDSSEPASWTLVDTGSAGLILDHMVAKTTGSGDAALDEIRMGGTWTDMIAPATVSVYIDFSAQETDGTHVDGVPRTWNVVNANTTDLLDDGGSATAVDMTIDLDASDVVDSAWGYDQGGTQAPGLDWASDASGDCWEIKNTDGIRGSNSTITFSDLTTNGYYDLVIFGGRFTSSGDTRNLALRVNHVPATGGWTAKNTATAQTWTYDGVQADENGEILIEMYSTSGGLGHLNAMQISWVATTEPAPAMILDILPVGGNIVKVVVKVPDAANLYVPVATTNLVEGIWDSVPHSDDPSHTFYTTDLSYSVPDATGTNEVIYLQTDEAAKFFRIIAE